MIRLNLGDTLKYRHSSSFRGTNDIVIVKNSYGGTIPVPDEGEHWYSAPILLTEKKYIENQNYTTGAVSVREKLDKQKT